MARGLPSEALEGGSRMTFFAELYDRNIAKTSALDIDLKNILRINYQL